MRGSCEDVLGFVCVILRGGQAVEIAPREGLKLRRQMAAAAGEKVPVSLSLSMEVNNLQVEEELPTMATCFWAEGVWMNRWDESSTRRGARETHMLYHCPSWTEVRNPPPMALCKEYQAGGVRVGRWCVLIVTRR